MSDEVSTQALDAIHIVAHQNGVPAINGCAIGHALLTAAFIAAPTPVPAPIQVILAKLHFGIQD